MHIFLSGPPGIGKSTIIRKVVETLQVVPGGFLTRSYFDGGKELAAVRILSPDGYDPSAEVGLRLPDGTWESNADVFNEIGVALLERQAKAPLILMDELGFMEERAKRFQEKVLACLYGPCPVLGVMKPFSLPFLDQVRAVSGVREIAVDRENRQRLPGEIIKMLWEKDGLK